MQVSAVHAFESAVHDEPFGSAEEEQESLEEFHGEKEKRRALGTTTQGDGSKPPSSLNLKRALVVGLTAGRRERHACPILWLRVGIVDVDVSVRHVEGARAVHADNLRGPDFRVRK